MIVAHNLPAMNGLNQLTKNTKSKRSSMEKLSSGFQINRAADDAAGLSISEKMRNQIRGLNQSVKNAEDGISLIKTADGAMGSIHSILQRVRELAVKAANDTNASDDRQAIQEEIDNIVLEIDTIVDKTKFNGRDIFSHQNWREHEGTLSNSSRTDIPLSSVYDPSTGSNYNIDVSEYTWHAAKMDEEFVKKVGAANAKDDTLFLQVGANAGEDMKLYRYAISSTSLFMDEMDVSSHAKALDAIARVDAAVKMVSEVRSYYGAMENRLEYTINNLQNYSENLTNAESTIRDTDMATMMTQFSKESILEQAAQAMLSQSSQSTQGVLALIQG